VHPASEPPGVTKRRMVGAHFTAVLWVLFKIGALVGLVAATQGVKGFIGDRGTSGIDREISVEIGDAITQAISDSGGDASAAAIALGLPEGVDPQMLIDNPYQIYRVGGSVAFVNAVEDWYSEAIRSTHTSMLGAASGACSTTVRCRYHSSN
jgi:hypothetical protein